MSVPAPIAMTTNVSCSTKLTTNIVLDLPRLSQRAVDLGLLAELEAGGQLRHMLHLRLGLLAAVAH